MVLALVLAVVVLGGAVALTVGRRGRATPGLSRGTRPAVTGGSRRDYFGDGPVAAGRADEA